MCWDFGEGGWRSAFGGIGSLNLDEAKLDALLTVGKPSRLAPSGAAVEKVRRGALLTVGKPSRLAPLRATQLKGAAAEEVKRDASLPPPNAERRTPNAERRTPNAERRTPNGER